MKIVNVGKSFQVYGEDLNTFDALPAQIYLVKFEKMKGFSLERHPDFEISEEKIYGVHKSKINKVMNSYLKFNRSLGVILSGDKGIGKSLFAKLLCNQAIEQGLPVVIIDKYIPDIAAYIASIEQEVVVLFDEFDKTYESVSFGESRSNPQTELLGLFDGVSQGKKMYVITCNQVNRLNEYLVNRTGRFHYHFRFEYPTTEEIQIYLHDKLDKEYYGEIEKVCDFASKVDVNYDSLRAIAFELNNGENFSEAIRDLNILKMEGTNHELILNLSNGTTVIDMDWSSTIDLFNPKQENTWRFTNKDNIDICITFNLVDAEFDVSKGNITIPSDNFITCHIDDSNSDNKNPDYHPVSIEIKKAKKRSLHYMV